MQHILLYHTTQYNNVLFTTDEESDMFEKFRVLIKDTVKDSMDAVQTPKRLLKKDIRVDSKISVS